MCAQTTCVMHLRELAGPRGLREACMRVAGARGPLTTEQIGRLVGQHHQAIQKWDQDARKKAGRRLVVLT